MEIVIQYNSVDQEFIASVPQVAGLSVKAKSEHMALLQIKQAIHLYIENFPERIDDYDTRLVDVD